MFNGEALSAGKYALFTFPYEDRWTLALSSESDVFFATTQPDPKFDVVKTSVPVTTSEKLVEQFTIEFTNDSLGTNMTLAWEKTVVSVPLR